MGHSPDVVRIGIGRQTMMPLVDPYYFPEVKQKPIHQNRVGGWFQINSGVHFYPMDPRPEDILIEDIAHALSRICRFGGHVRDGIYSVASHSMLVADLLPDGKKLAGLLHDATEAYLGDIVSPLKRSLPDYRDVEDRLAAIIADKFGVNFDDSDIKHADMVALATEARDLLTNCTWIDELPVRPSENHHVEPDFAPGSTKICFLSCFKQYQNLKHFTE